MQYDCDPNKRASNLLKHGVDFAEIERFDWGSALVSADVRLAYGEVRLVALGLIGSRVHVVVFAFERRILWLISLRKTNKKETDVYVSI